MSAKSRCNWPFLKIHETQFSVMVRSLGLHRIEAQSYLGLLGLARLGQSHSEGAFPRRARVKLSGSARRHIVPRPPGLLGAGFEVCF